MRVIRSDYEHEWDRPVPGITIETEPRRTGYASLEIRVLLNPIETKTIDAVRWLYYYVWDEHLVYPIQRLACRWLGRHSRACRGRTGHH